jgi:hypothetical protein
VSPFPSTTCSRPAALRLAASDVPTLDAGSGHRQPLLAPQLARCDRERMPAYLESSKEQNVPLYERNGFEVTEVVQLPNGGPPAWLIWREPK